MARIVQVLLPLVCIVIAEAQIHIPFFDFGLHHPAHPISDDRLSHQNSWQSGNTWFQHYGNPDAHRYSSGSHERVNSYEDYDPFYHRDHYYHDDWDNMPEIHNVFNIPSPGHGTHKHLPSHKPNNPDQTPKHDHNEGTNAQKPDEKPKNVPAHDEKPTDEKHDGNNMNEDIIQKVKNITETMPPKTNPIKKEDDKGGKDDKSVAVDKKKDFLLVGQGGNGENKVFLLHENTPNPPNTVVVPNINQPGGNIIYVPYNPGQPNNQVYQVVNGQPAPSGTNLTPDKIGVSPGYNTVPSNPVQPAISTGQNPGYVTIYSNGQLIQIPGVVVNPAPNNAPSVIDNQGTKYMIANAVPNNVQTVPAASNPQTPNVIYATLPNQPSNGPIYIQMPSCMQSMPNGCSGTVVQNPVQGGNNGLPNNVILYQPSSNTVAQPAVYPNGVSNGYGQPNVVTSPDQGTIAVANPSQNVYNNPNNQYQPATFVNSGSNSYNQPIVSTLGPAQNAPNPGVMTNQNLPVQPEVQPPVSNNNNGYNQPLVSSQKQPANEGIMNNQNMPLQPAVEMPVNNMPVYQPMPSNQGQPNAPNQGASMQPAVEIPLTNGYNEHPPVINPDPNLESRSQMPNNQNVPQPPLSANSDSNGYSQPPQAPNQGDQGANGVVNAPVNAGVVSQPENNQPLATSLVLDSSNLSAFGAQPAIMISDFKDTKDKVKSKDEKKKEKKEKGKKKDNKKPKEEDKEEKPKVKEPFTNKNKKKK